MKQKNLVTSFMNSQSTNPPPAAESTKLTPNIISEFATLMFHEGSVQALPIRLKILFDRLLSQLETDEALKLLTSFGWSLQDYARGYILMVRKSPFLWLLPSSLTLEKSLRLFVTNILVSDLSISLLNPDRDICVFKKCTARKFN